MLPDTEAEEPEAPVLVELILGDAPDTKDAPDEVGVLEIADPLAVPDVLAVMVEPETTDVPDESIPLEAIPDEVDVPDALDVLDAVGMAEIPDTPDEEDAPERTEVALETPDTPDARDVPDALDAVETLDIFDASEGPVPDAIEELDSEVEPEVTIRVPEEPERVEDPDTLADGETVSREFESVAVPALLEPEWLVAPEMNPGVALLMIELPLKPGPSLGNRTGSLLAPGVVLVPGRPP